MSNYKYSALESAESFRLVTISPGSYKDKIQFALSTVAFSAYPDYECLSYTWGTNEKTHQMFHEEELIFITDNLDKALRRLRYPDKPRILWVDAICINQEDFTERIQQVMIMGKIFNKATMVLAWVGEGSEADKEAFQMIHSFEDESGSDGYEEFSEGHVLPTTPNRPWPQPAVFMSSQEGWVYAKSLTSFLARPWFTRSWVVQEVVLAKQTKIISGTRSCSWSALSRLAYYLTFNIIPGLHGLRLVPIRVITYFRRIEAGDISKHGISFIHLLDFTRSYNCTVPQDKVFAFLGLNINFDGIKFVVDYQVPFENLFISIAQQAVLIPKFSFFILSIAGYTSQTSLNKHLPSWVPDWSAKLIGTNSIGRHPIPGGSNYRAATYLTVEICLGSMLHTIVVSGYLFDSIEILDDRQNLVLPLDSEDKARSDEEVQQFRRSLMDTSYRISIKSQPYPTGEDWLCAYTRFLAGNMRLYGYRGVDKFDSYFLKGYQAIMNYMKITEELIGKKESLDGNEALKKFARKKKIYEANVLAASDGRRICASSKKYLGWVPESAQVGDLICVFKGAHKPYILRKSEGDTYKLIGECYVHGIMESEAREMDLEEKKFTIV